MGVYTSGYAEFEFSRALTAKEYATWLRDAALAEYTANYREGTARVEDEFEFNTSSWGDVGVIHTALKSLYINPEGKVYDITEALQAVFSVLPADVKVSGGGDFDSDGNDWGIRVREDGRTLYEVGGKLYFEDELEPVTGALDTAKKALAQALSGFSHGRLSTGFKALKKATEAVETAQGGLR